MCDNCKYLEEWRYDVSSGREEPVCQRGKGEWKIDNDHLWYCTLHIYKEVSDGLRSI